MARQIYCEVCGQYQGDIESRNLHKGLKYVCPECWDRMYKRKEFSGQDPTLEILRKMFGMVG